MTGIEKTYYQVTCPECGHKGRSATEHIGAVVLSDCSACPECGRVYQTVDHGTAE